MTEIQGPPAVRVSLDCQPHMSDAVLARAAMVDALPPDRRE